MGCQLANPSSAGTTWRRRAGIMPLHGEDTQASSCADQRRPASLRTVRPELTEGFAERHNKFVWRCLGAPREHTQADEAQVLATLALSARGLGLSSAQRFRRAAHFAKLRMVRKRPSLIAESTIKHPEEGTAP